jgi:N-acetylglucosaminyl-diphospho-decaprenol L-rhamnosyltransferase
VTTGSDWTLITVAYNSARALEAAWREAEIGDARWIVVDNASTDDSVAVAKSLGAEVVELPDNRGFSAANNVGLERVATEWVAFVNPDLTIGKAADLGRLAAVSAANGGALVAPQLLNSDGTEQPNGRGLPYLLDKVANRGVRLPGARLHEYVRTGLTGPTYVAWLTGAAVAGPLDVMHRLGGWDERFFLYYEDVDLGLRAWGDRTSVILDPGVRWVHAWERATKGPNLTAWRLALRSAWTFFRTYPGLLHRRWRKSPGLVDHVEGQVWSVATNV